MVGLGQAVPDAVFIADPVEDVTAEHGLELGVAAAILGQVGKRHAVVGQDRVQLVGKDLDHLAQEGGAVGFSVGVQEGDVGELGYPIDGEKHEQLALRQAQLADVDVHVTDPGFGKALALGRLLLAFGQAGDAMTDEATVASTSAREPGDGFAQAAQHVVQRQEGAAPELDHDGLLGLA
jgi:hypothetical protein